ncbi:ATP-binding protein [Streptomyces marincola]|uniref:ATP-binding protein n=1 Tax=Streptomyces marincola TaxID=2878388 RepID=UPI001CF13EF4|nr:ATP-binding protein [Streptomyces marincola]UCM90170.1 ATP-binding protein [Streptomyces marincola]
MSHPLTRRLTKAALLLVAGTAPVVGAAGQAAAAPLPQTPDLTGLVAPEHLGAEETLNHTVGDVTGVAERVAGPTVREVAPVVVPLVHDTARETGRTTAGLGMSLAHKAAQIGPTPTELQRMLPSMEDPSMHLITLP